MKCKQLFYSCLHFFISSKLDAGISGFKYPYLRKYKQDNTC